MQVCAQADRVLRLIRFQGVLEHLGARYDSTVDAQGAHDLAFWLLRLTCSALMRDRRCSSRLQDLENHRAVAQLSDFRDAEAKVALVLHVLLHQLQLLLLAHPEPAMPCQD